ncbi:hypothetical protein [Alloactinosynnema sp. L-07]|nr:hypothetical protein [Alloactinosynnema sp. L-07]
MFATVPCGPAAAGGAASAWVAEALGAMLITLMAMKESSRIAFMVGSNLFGLLP